MKLFNLKNRKYFQGILLLFGVIFLFVLLFSPFRNLGIVLISLSALFIAVGSYSKFSNTKENRFRSRARDQNLKDENEIS